MTAPADRYAHRAHLLAIYEDAVEAAREIKLNEAVGQPDVWAFLAGEDEDE